VKTLCIVVVVALSGRIFAAEKPLATGAPASPTRVAPFTCVARLEVARADLLSAGFNPAKDTAEWLRVSTLERDARLSVYTVYSPDGDGYRTFQAEVTPFRGKPIKTWRLVSRKVLDEFKEERLPERTWTRTRGDGSLEFTRERKTGR
jgi:hypothetical protein